MTLHTDVASVVQSLAIPKYERECEEKARARAYILSMMLAARPANDASSGDAAAVAMTALSQANAELEAATPEQIPQLLARQAVALNVIFREYGVIAARTTDIVSVQTYMGFALKAQTQCRVTAEAIKRIAPQGSPSSASSAPPTPPSPQNRANEILPARRPVGRTPHFDAGEGPSSTCPPKLEERRGKSEGGASALAARSSNPQKSPNEILRTHLLSSSSFARPENPPN